MADSLPSLIQHIDRYQDKFVKNGGCARAEKWNGETWGPVDASDLILARAQLAFEEETKKAWANSSCSYCEQRDG